MLCRENRQSRATQSGCAVNKEHCKSPGGTRTTAIMAERVKSSKGSGNARWRRESGGGNTDQPEADRIRVSAEKAEHEKLNDERGVKPLPVSRSRDGAESEQTGSGGIGEQLLYSSPRNHRAKSGGNYARAGAQDIPDRSGRKRPTDVTAVAKSRTNRARSVATGVVSGASQVSRCFKGRTLMRVSPVGLRRSSIRAKAKRILGKAVQAAGACYGWCRAQLHTRKRRRDEPISRKWWAGGFKLHLPIVLPENCVRGGAPGDRPRHSEESKSTEP